MQHSISFNPALGFGRRKGLMPSAQHDKLGSCTCPPENSPGGSTFSVSACCRIPTPFFAPKPDVATRLKLLDALKGTVESKAPACTTADTTDVVPASGHRAKAPDSLNSGARIRPPAQLIVGQQPLGSPHPSMRCSREKHPAQVL